MALFCSLHLDFRINTSRKSKILETLDSLRVGIKDVDKTLVDFHLESLTAGLVDVWGLHHGEGAALGWKRDWARNAGAGTNRGVDDLASALVDDTVIISFEADTDGKAAVFSFCHFCLSCSITSETRVFRA